MIWIIGAFLCGSVIGATVAYSVCDPSEAISKASDKIWRDARESAVMSGYGQWNIDNKTKGSTRFEWFTRKEIAERWNAEQAEKAAEGKDAT